MDYVLKKEGYETFISKDGNDAVEQIGTIQPDLIITDIMIPYKSGLEITASKKSYPYSCYYRFCPRQRRLDRD
jgi:DNA-binding response OmpR family regulator